MTLKRALELLYIFTALYRGLQVLKLTKIGKTFLKLMIYLKTPFFEIFGIGPKNFHWAQESKTAISSVGVTKQPPF